VREIDVYLRRINVYLAQIVVYLAQMTIDLLMMPMQRFAHCRGPRTAPWRNSQLWGNSGAQKNYKTREILRIAPLRQTF
jgi:hypothetical protein